MLRIAAYILALGALSAVVLEARPALRYASAIDKYRWNGEKFFRERGEIDSAFFGSSQMWNAVDTGLLNEQQPGRLHYNFGVHLEGHDLQAVLIRDLLRERKVRRVVLEVDPVEKESHPSFDYFFAPRDLLVTPFDRSAMRASIDRLTTRVGFTMVRGFVALVRSFFVAPVPDLHAGYFAPVGGPPIAPVPVVRRAEVREMTLRSVRRIAETCAAAGAELVLLHVPVRDGLVPSVEYVERLGAFGQVVVIDPTPFLDASFWADDAHMNAAGARVFTTAVAAALP